MAYNEDMPFRPDRPPIAAGIGTGAGASRARFRTTAWSKVARAGDCDSATREAALRELFQLYWQPVYGYLRYYYSMKPEEAADATQDFFAWALETGFFAKPDRNKGTFRSLLKTSLRNFVAGSYRKRHSEKRGGRMVRWTLEKAKDEAPSGDLTPEEILDREWGEVLLDRAVKRLREGYVQDGKTIYADVFERFHIDGKSYDEISQLLEIPHATIENHLRAARKRIREILVDLVSETVASPEDLEGELREIFG